jgi:hypothetical protein
VTVGAVKVLAVAVGVEVEGLFEKKTRYATRAMTTTARTGKTMFRAFLARLALGGSCCCFRGLDFLFFLDKTHPAHGDAERIPALRINPPSPNRAVDRENSS